MKKIFKLLGNNPYFNALRNIRDLLDYDQKKRGAIMLLLLVVNAVFDVLGLVAIFPLMDAALDQSQIQEKPYLKFLYNMIGIDDVVLFLFVLSIIVFLIFLAKNAASLFILYIQSRYSFNVSLRLSLKQFQKYYKNGYLYIQGNDVGRRLYDIYQLPYQFAGSYMVQVFIFTTELLVLLIIFVIVGFYAPKAFIVLLFVIIPVFVLIYTFSKRSVTRIGVERNELFPKVSSIISESMTAYADVKLANKEANIMHRYKSMQHRLNMIDALNVGLFNKIPTKSNDVVFALGIMLVFFAAVLFQNSSSEILSILSVFALAGYRFLPSVNKMMGATLNMKNLSFLKEELESIKNQKLIEFKKIERLNFSDHIEFSKVSYHYPESKSTVLENFSLQIKKGETVGIIGGSGSGKTTLLNILLRLLTETSGEIRVDGKILKNELNASFQKNIGFVQQQVFIKNGTLSENVAFGEDEPDGIAVNNAVENAMLKTFVDDHPQGMNMILGENGVKLSGGQRQRVGIARALYKKSDILVFDEATSALDMETENAIKETITMLTKLDKTIFIVAHRITTLDSCDRIIELEKGTIKREITYQELFDDKILDKRINEK